MDFSLSRDSRLFLLKAARNAIRSKMDSIVPETGDIPHELGFSSGCFVTIHLRGRLRGCIGNFREDINIVNNVTAMACQAAFSDPRFGPVSKDELGMCELEISVLSPMIKASAEEITVGRDGIYIIKGSARGVLLPQVATEHNWDRETFLSQTCLKAGLPEDSWRERDTEILRFEALVFSEDQVN